MMNNVAILSKKEFVQMIRDFKIVWFPLVFILLGMMQPVLSYYLPALLKAMGGDQGITIDPSFFEQLKGGEVLATTLESQFDQLGLLIIVISLMGAVQSDKANGMLAFILTRPVSVTQYIGAKVLSNYWFVAACVAIGYLASYAYVNLLFSNVSFADMLLALLFYLVWVLFIISFTTMFSTLFNNQGIIALLSIVLLLLCRSLVGINSFVDLINPAMMSAHAVEILMTGIIHSKLTANLLITLILCFAAILISKDWIAKKKYDNS